MKSLFNHENKIDLSRNNVYYLVDDKNSEITRFVSKNENFDLEIKTQNDYIFIDNDRYIMNNAEERIKKCDWIVFNFQKFYFIEAKNVLDNYRKQAREEAYLKFEHTLEYYKSFNFEYSIKKFAVLNFRKQKNDISNAAMKELKEKYKTYLKLNYTETNQLII